MASATTNVRVYRCLASNSDLYSVLGTTFWDGQSAVQLNVHPSASDPARRTFSQTIRDTQGAFILHFPSSSSRHPSKLLLLAYNRNKHVGSPVGAPAVECSEDFASQWIVMARAHLLIEGPTFTITPNDPEYHILMGNGPLSYPPPVMPSPLSFASRVSATRHHHDQRYVRT